MYLHTTKSERQLLRDNTQPNVANQFTAPTYRNKTMAIYSTEVQYEAIGEVASKCNLRKAVYTGKERPAGL